MIWRIAILVAIPFGFWITDRIKEQLIQDFKEAFGKDSIISKILNF